MDDSVIENTADEKQPLAVLPKTLLISTSILIALLAIPHSGIESLSFACGLIAILTILVTIYLCFSDLSKALSVQNRSKFLNFAAFIPLVNTILLFVIIASSKNKNFGLFKRLILSFLGTLWFSAVFIIVLTIAYIAKNQRPVEQSNQQAVTETKETYTANKTPTPLPSTFHLERGKVFIKAAKYDLALEELNKALRFNSNLEDAYLLRAGVYGKLNKNEEALADINRALHLNPKNYLGYVLRSGILHGMGDKDGALHAIKTAQALNPSEELKNLEKHLQQ